MNRREKIVKIIRSILDQHEVEFSFDVNDLRFGEKAITEITGNKQRLSKAILDHMFPYEPAPAVLYHYTSFQGVEGIAKTGKLYLFPIKNKLGQGGELEAFALAHGLDGYLDTSKGSPFYRQLSEDLFYISMTRSVPKDPVTMWGGFAKNTGARLQFTMKPTPAAELRPIHYEERGSTTLLREINDALKNAGEPPFNPWTISKIGAFYLKSSVAVEDEVRLLLKYYRDPDALDFTKGSGDDRYWPIAIGEPNAFCWLELTEVHVAPGADRAAIEAVLKNSIFAAVPVTGTHISD